MTTSSTKTERTETGRLEQQDQEAWEAPAVRPTFTPDGATETWAAPCPTWCTGIHSSDTQAGAVKGAWRHHESSAIRVRVDGMNRFYGEFEGREGIWAGHLTPRLHQTSRGSGPAIVLESHYGNSLGEEQTHTHPPMFFDEVRELIAVLQHLMKLGQE